MKKILFFILIFCNVIYAGIFHSKPLDNNNNLEKNTYKDEELLNSYYERTCPPLIKIITKNPDNELENLYSDCKSLLEQGAQVNEIYFSKHDIDKPPCPITPLAMAVARYNWILSQFPTKLYSREKVERILNIIKLLLEYHADPFLKLPEGSNHESAYVYAKNNNLKEIIDLFDEYAQKIN